MRTVCDDLLHIPLSRALIRGESFIEKYFRENALTVPAENIHVLAEIIHVLAKIILVPAEIMHAQSLFLWNFSFWCDRAWSVGRGIPHLYGDVMEGWLEILRHYSERQGVVTSGQVRQLYCTRLSSGWAGHFLGYLSSVRNIPYRCIEIREMHCVLRGRSRKVVSMNGK